MSNHLFLNSSRVSIVPLIIILTTHLWTDDKMFFTATFCCVTLSGDIKVDQLGVSIAIVCKSDKSGEHTQTL